MSDQPDDSPPKIRRAAPARARSGRVVRPTSRSAVEPHVEQLATIGELMLGAAYADGEKVGVEIVAICEQLKEFVEASLLPSEVRRRLDQFDPAAFDIEAACSKLRFHTDNDRLFLMKLVATVTGADSVVHPSEKNYLDRVAIAVGLDPKSLSISFSAT